MNKRLASRPEQDINESFWWDSFTNEFFDDDAKLSMRNVLDENIPKNFTISRTLIPRFFRSIYEGGVTDLHFNLARGGNTNVLAPRKVDPQFPATNLVVFETDLCTMTSKYGKPMYAIIFTEGHLVVEFTSQQQHDPQGAPFPINDAPIRISNFIFSIRRHQELVPRSTIAIQQDQAGIEQLSKNITRTGLANQTLNYLKLCSVLEPMQEIMSRSKMTQAVPRECLKQTVMMGQKQGMAPGAGGRMGMSPVGTPTGMAPARTMGMTGAEDLVKAEKVNQAQPTVAAAPGMYLNPFCYLT